jgi:hypothetical protein
MTRGRARAIWTIVAKGVRSSASATRLHASDALEKCLAIAALDVITSGALLRAGLFLEGGICAERPRRT